MSIVCAHQESCHYNKRSSSLYNGVLYSKYILIKMKEEKKCIRDDDREKIKKKFLCKRETDRER